jgi:hypothetical protein
MEEPEQPSGLPNGLAAAAILSAAAGCFAVSLFAWLGDAKPAIAHFFIFYTPTGPLSGVTTSAIALWLLLWLILGKLWAGRNVALGAVSAVSFLLLGLGFLLSFPPIAELLMGK